MIAFAFILGKHGDDLQEFIQSSKKSAEKNVDFETASSRAYSILLYLSSLQHQSQLAYSILESHLKFTRVSVGRRRLFVHF